jgi:hypothetical protein
MSICAACGLAFNKTGRGRWKFCSPACRYLKGKRNVVSEQGDDSDDVAGGMAGQWSRHEYLRMDATFGAAMTKAGFTRTTEAPQKKRRPNKQQAA